MTDNEIIKALECCLSQNGECDNCPQHSRTCVDDLLHQSLDLINRQKAEIERWRTECGNQSTLWSKHYESIFETAKETIKAEAIKEFAERVREELTPELKNSYDMRRKRVEDLDDAGIFSGLDVVIKYNEGKIHALEKINKCINIIVKEKVGDSE